MTSFETNNSSLHVQDMDSVAHVNLGGNLRSTVRNMNGDIIFMVEKFFKNTDNIIAEILNEMYTSNIIQKNKNNNLLEQENEDDSESKHFLLITSEIRSYGRSTIIYTHLKNAARRLDRRSRISSGVVEKLEKIVEKSLDYYNPENPRYSISDYWIRAGLPNRRPCPSHCAYTSERIVCVAAAKRVYINKYPGMKPISDSIIYIIDEILKVSLQCARQEASVNHRVTISPEDFKFE